MRVYIALLLLCLGCTCAYAYNSPAGEDKELALRELLYRLLSDPETRGGEEYKPMELNRDVNGWGCKKPCPPEKPHCAHYLGICTTYK